MNHYFTSSGQRVSKDEIKRKISEAKKQRLQMQLDEHGYNFCEVCKKENIKYINDLEYKILDCSHLESVKKSQDNRRSELAWDISNIQILCRHHHRIFDGLNLRFDK